MDEKREPYGYRMPQRSLAVLPTSILIPCQTMGVLCPKIIKVGVVKLA